MSPYDEQNWTTHNVKRDLLPSSLSADAIEMEDTIRQKGSDNRIKIQRYEKDGEADGKLNFCVEVCRCGEHKKEPMVRGTDKTCTKLAQIRS